MTTSGNGSRPHRGSPEIAAELRQRLEQRLGPERTDEIWRDPTAIEKVVRGEEEAADVARIIMRAWQDLPSDEAPATKSRWTGFRRGLQIAVISALAVWSIAVLRRVRRSRSDETP